MKVHVLFLYIFFFVIMEYAGESKVFARLFRFEVDLKKDKRAWKSAPYGNNPSRSVGSRTKELERSCEYFARHPSINILLLCLLIICLLEFSTLPPG